MTDCNLGFSNKERKFCRESAPSNLIGANGFADQVRSSDGFCQEWEQPIAYRFLRAVMNTAVEDINLDVCAVRVTRQLNKPGAVPAFGPPKSRACRSVADFADLIVPDLSKHWRWQVPRRAKQSSRGTMPPRPINVAAIACMPTWSSLGTGGRACPLRARSDGKSR